MIAPRATNVEAPEQDSLAEKYATNRLMRSAPERTFVKEQLKMGTSPTRIDTPQRVALRMKHLSETGAAPRELRDRVLKTAVSEDEPAGVASEETELGLERIIDNRDLLSVIFLYRGWRSARSVGCVRDPDGAIGAGFLVTLG